MHRHRILAVFLGNPDFRFTKRIGRVFAACIEKKKSDTSDHSETCLSVFGHGNAELSRCAHTAQLYEISAAACKYFCELDDDRIFVFFGFGLWLGYFSFFSGRCGFTVGTRPWSTCVYPFLNFKGFHCLA